LARILVVDDDETDRLGLAALLRSDGHEVVLARDGNEALDLYLQKHVHVVVTDIVMPGRDGLSLISVLKEVDPRVSVVAVSGKSPSKLEASKVYGARVLTKPVDRKRLLAAVREAAGTHDKGH
jgi:two-component system cell cycle sensor histidine kinase/response regulator CckA